MAAAWLLSAPPVAAFSDEVRVPIALQAELLSKVARYDQNLTARAGEVLQILVVHRTGDEQSTGHARQFQAQLDKHRILADRPQTIEVAALGAVAELAALCAARRIAIVVLSSGFSPAEVRAVAEALAGRDVLTHSLAAKDVPAGAVIGFDVVSSKPKILVNVRQAQRQRVQLASALLSLAMVVP